MAACAPGLAVHSDSRQVVATMTPERIEEAIRLAADEPAARAFLSRYTVQTHAGWGDGPRIGSFSTPFVRVVLAAMTAARSGKPFSAADVSADDVAAELHVIVAFQPAAAGDVEEVAAESVTITRRGVTDRGEDIQPLRMAALTPSYRSRYGLMSAGAGIVAAFPLTVLASDRGIRVGFRQVVKGSSAISNCKECVVPFPSVSDRWH